MNRWASFSGPSGTKRQQQRFDQPTNSCCAAARLSQPSAAMGGLRSQFPQRRKDVLPMKKLLALACAFAVSSTCQCCGPTQRSAFAAQVPEEKVKQRPLDTLLKDLQSKDEQTRLQAIIDLSDHGPKAAKAIPELVKAL